MEDKEGLDRVDVDRRWQGGALRPRGPARLAPRRFGSPRRARVDKNAGPCRRATPAGPLASAGACSPGENGGRAYPADRSGGALLVLACLFAHSRFPCSSAQITTCRCSQSQSFGSRCRMPMISRRQWRALLGSASPHVPVPPRAPPRCARDVGCHAGRAPVSFRRRGAPPPSACVISQNRVIFSLALPLYSICNRLYSTSAEFDAPRERAGGASRGQIRACFWCAAAVSGYSCDGVEIQLRGGRQPCARSKTILATLLF